MDAFNKGMRLRDIACELFVELPTAEVYLIDSLVAGKDLHQERLGEYLHITNEHFLLLRNELLVKPRLSMVKQSYPGNCEEELPKKPVGRLPVNCRPSVDRQVTDSLPTVNQQVTDRLRKKENCGKHEQLT